MTLKEALINQGETDPDNTILDMVERVMNDEDPEEVLQDYGLEPDYVIDLLNEVS